MLLYWHAICFICHIILKGEWRSENNNNSTIQEPKLCHQYNQSYIRRILCQQFNFVQ